MYYAGEGRQLTTYPKLLLLDEVDAPLHPSMSRHFISTITETLVKKLGVNVIATTHSPSTVAIAPNESIHVMRVDQPGVHKTSKAEALNLLTYGVPTLAIDYSGRRQVFVESPIDAELYENLYQLLKSRLGSELSLQFVGVGRENPLTGTHEQAGSTIVAPMVSQLEKSGNLSIFGLLDWDSINTPIGRLHVVGQNERYTLENIILDPLAIAALIVRTTTTKKYLPKLGLSEDTSYVDLLSFTGEKLQALADKVTELLFDEQQRMDIQECKYVGGQSLVLRTIYLHTKGHDLGNLIMDKIPEFKIFKSKLKQEIVGQIFKDKPEFIPIVLIDAFDRLLSAPNHS